MARPAFPARAPAEPDALVERGSADPPRAARPM